MKTRSLNFTYRLVWSDVCRMFVAVAEFARTHKKRSSALVLSAALLANLAQAQQLPTGGQVVAGQGNIASNGATMTVTQNTANMAVNWQSFSIGQGNTVNFVQPSASAVALNRVLGSDVSLIQGALNANGKIFLINPNGVLFTPTAQVNVGSLVASTLNISTADFMAGNYRFEGISSNAITNQGNITTAAGGTVALFAARIINTGQINAPQGKVLMAAGSKVTLDLGGPVKIQVEEGTLNALIEQGGGVRADGGLVYLTAKAAGELATSVINHTGITEASSLTEKGGKIVLEGDRIQLADGSRITATGATGGGEVYVGGGWQGSGTIRHATTVTMAKNAAIDVSATQAGDGGTAVLWSDVTNTTSQTRAYGTIWAKGGMEGGNGGRIETSGHWLDVAGSQGGASAAKGQAGLWLFDPYNVTITSANANGSFGSASGTDTWTPSGNNSTILNTDINSKLENGTNVTITTGTTGAQVGDITVASAITKNAGAADVTLTLQAANSIVVDQAISNTGGTGKLNVVLDADNNNGTGDGAGIVMLNTGITTNGGHLSFGTGRTATINSTSTLVGGDVFVGGSNALTLSTNGGNVDVKGEMLVANTNGLTINSNGGNVSFYGLLNSGNQYTFVDKTGSPGTGSWSDARTEAINGTGGGSAVNDSYLVTITSRLENSVAVRAAGYKGVWIGAWRPNEANGAWVWANGPEASQQFFTQTTNGSGGVTASGYYANFGTGEPNGSMTASPAERVAQFFGTAAQWNDLNLANTYSATQSSQYAVLGFVKETNLAASPLTINAGSGAVTFSGAVGGNKALASLNVSSTGGIAISGGGVTTEGAQTYAGNITLGAANTTLQQTNANTDFTIQSGKTITNAAGADASLTIKTTGNIVMDANTSISSSSGKLNTTLWSDSDNSGSGYIFIHDGNTISTNGGKIVMAGGLDNGVNGGTAGDGTPDGYATSATANYSGVSIGRLNNTATAGTTIQSGGGDILIRGKSTAATGNGMGINFSRSGTLDAGSGTLTMVGESSSYAGIELSAWLPGGGTDSYLDIHADTVNIRGKSSNTNRHGLASSQLLNQYTRITAGDGGISLYGENTVNSSKGVEVSLNATTTGGGNITVESPNYVAIYRGDNAHSFNAGTGNTTLRANTLSIGSNHTFNGSGTLTVEPSATGTTIGIAGGTGTLQLPASYFSTNFVNGFSGITVGNAAAGAITVGSATTFQDNITLKNNSTIALFGAITANENLTLSGNGNIAQSAPLAVAGTTSIATGIGNISLANTANDFTGAVTVVSGNNISIVDSNAMTLGAVNTSGTIDIATLTGNLTLTGAVTTTDTTANAIQLNAGKSAAAGTATGGDIVVSGGSVNVDTGGTAKLYSGSVAGSTGLTSLVGSGSSHFRYNSDETATNYTTALTTGTHAIYREQPTVTVTAKDATQTVGGAGYSGGNGVTTSGLVNGDTVVLAFGGTLTYGGTSQGATAVGTYSIIPSGYSSGLGYALSYANGTLTMTEAPVDPTATPKEAAIQTVQTLPPTAGTLPTPTIPSLPPVAPSLPNQAQASISGGLVFVDVPANTPGTVAPQAATSSYANNAALAGYVPVLVVDGGIHFGAPATNSQNK